MVLALDTKHNEQHVSFSLVANEERMIPEGDLLCGWSQYFSSIQCFATVY